MATEDNVVDSVIGSQEDEATDLFAEEAFDDEYNEFEGEEESLTSGTDWETEAKKFQSMKDKAEAKLEDWQQFKPLVNLLESRPDLVQMIQENITSQVSNGNARISEEDFNPWDAYFKPDSPSYQFREIQEQDKVNSAIQKEMGALQEQVFINNLTSELQNTYKMNENEAREFLTFYAQPKEDLSLDALVDVFVKSKGKERSKSSSSLDAVRAAKNSPRTPGAVPSRGPTPKSEDDKVWDGVMASANAGRLP